VPESFQVSRLQVLGWQEFSFFWSCDSVAVSKLEKTKSDRLRVYTVCL